MSENPTHVALSPVPPADAWSTTSWRQRVAKQQPMYPDAEEFARCVQKLSSKPPLVAPGEVVRLRHRLAEAARGERFVLHGGDCAETFDDCTAESLQARLKMLLQMSLVLTHATRRPVLRIGRLAGQYAKPRSAATEQLAGQELPSYRGDLINGLQATPQARRPDPERILHGYHHAAASLNYIRALIEGGFADLHDPRRWDLAFIERSPRRQTYRRIVNAIMDAVALMDTVGASTEALKRIEIYTSHEALLLPYEEALTRETSAHGVMNLGAHLLWVGYRTGDLDGAHVEYLRGLGNPVAVKVGPKMQPEHVLGLLERLNPGREAGRITLISRFGAEGVAQHLPELIRAVRTTDQPVLWSCDPMHGNTETVAGRKTRRVEAIFSELEQTFALHCQADSRLGGVHFEMTGENVTECVGGAVQISEEDLGRSYETACDPRLNPSQALEVAFLIAQTLHAESEDHG
ncbi:MAG: 3-deoxy-7-phosphoheptulonate synthase [Proteobacteria bacterium]|nr:3-deoxy-7-phosphoheptulonate synthase [Pseudomonadota bacterium]